MKKKTIQVILIFMILVLGGLFFSQTHVRPYEAVCELFEDSRQLIEKDKLERSRAYQIALSRRIDFSLFYILDFIRFNTDTEIKPFISFLFESENPPKIYKSYLQDQKIEYTCPAVDALLSTN